MSPRWESDPGPVPLQAGADLLDTNLHRDFLFVPPPLQAPSDWVASVSITPVSLGEGRCTSDPAGSRALLLPGDSRLV